MKRWLELHFGLALIPIAIIMLINTEGVIVNSWAMSVFAFIGLIAMLSCSILLIGDWLVWKFDIKYP